MKIKFVSWNYKLKAMLTKSKLKEKIENFFGKFSIDELLQKLILAIRTEFN